MTTPRLEALNAPFPDNVAPILAKYPQGPEGPIGLFRTLARSERILKKVGQSGLLDRASPIDMLDREIVILRTSARCQCRYEWGVHVAAFSAHVGLSSAQIKNTSELAINDELWTAQQKLLIQLVDELVDSKTLSDQCWQALSAHYNDAQMMELLLLTGFYHSIAFLNNALKIPQEPGTPSF